MIDNTVAYLLKFAAKEAYIDDLIDGRLYMNAAGYYHGLPGEQGDPLEASIVGGTCIYLYHRLPIYCMYAVRKSDVTNNSAVIPSRMIEEFGCATGWIGIIQYDRFARLLAKQTAEDGDIYAHGPISYGAPGPKLINEIFQGIPHNLVIKTPRYPYQKEYRIIGENPASFNSKSDKNNPRCKTEEHDHEVLDLGCKLTDFAWKVPVSTLKDAKDGLILNLPTVKSTTTTTSSRSRNC